MQFGANKSKNQRTRMRYVIVSKLNPKVFFLVCSIDPKYEPEYFKQILKREVNVKGISGTKIIIRTHFTVARNAFIVLDAEKTLALNNLERIEYDNVKYLLQNNMFALYRIFNKDSNSKIGVHGTIQNICTYLQGFIPDRQLKYDFEYYGYGSKIAYDIYNSNIEINNLEQLTKVITESLNRIERNGPYTVDLKNPLKKAILRIGEIYQDEEEYLVKDVLKIPENSLLVIGLDKKVQELYTKYKNKELSDIDLFFNQTTIDSTQIIYDAINQLKKEYRINIVDSDKFKKRRNQLVGSPTNPNKYELLADSLSELKLKDLADQYVYLGKGNARTTFAYNNLIVIKKAKGTDKGINQNLMMWDIWKWTKNKNLIPCFAISQNNQILLCSRATPIKTFTKNILKEIGIEKKRVVYEGRTYGIETYCLHGPKWDFLNDFELSGKGYIEDTKEVCYVGDFTRPSSWGLFKGKYVLLDYGY